MNVIFGAGGFAREVGWLLHDLAQINPVEYSLDAFVASDSAENVGKSIQGKIVLSETNFFKHHENQCVNVFIAVGSPELKSKIQNKCRAALNNARFPSLIHPSVCMDTRSGAILVGDGSIICAGCSLTTDIVLHDFVHINLGCTVGHDAVIGAYSTLSPGVHISGGVSTGAKCFLGTGAVLLENIGIPAGTIIGAGATVVSTIDAAGTYVGTPAKRRERN